MTIKKNPILILLFVLTAVVSFFVGSIRKSGYTVQLSTSDAQMNAAIIEYNLCFTHVSCDGSTDSARINGQCFNRFPCESISR